ncbi:MAG: preprotein translocase subunit SecG [Candidatus Omnitrophica bacterium]|nr:preprotein translocase subunit SecG [Candidatus Omnitrophota bacterium]
MLYGTVLTLHLIVCFVLIAVILLQAGRGGGLSDSFGGSSSSFFGTRGAVYLVRATAVSATVFMLTSLTLAFLSVRRGRSLMERIKVERVEPGPDTSGQEKE